MPVPSKADVKQVPESKCAVKVEQGVFGHARRADFAVDQTYVNVNHGSFGCVPKTVAEYRRSIEEECERNPNFWYKIRLQPMIDHCR